MNLSTINNALKTFEKFIISIVVISFVTLLIASTWENKVSDDVLNDLIVSLSKGKNPENIIISEQSPNFRLKEITENYKIELKDNNIFWGQIYRVKFDSGKIYGFYVDIGIISKHKVKILDYDDN